MTGAEFWALARERRALGLLSSLPMPDEGMKARAAAAVRQPFPTLHSATPATMGAWFGKYWAAFPAWGFDAVYLGEAARGCLPRVLADMGVGRMLGRVHHDPMMALLAGAKLPQLLALRPVVDWRDVLAALPPALLPLGGDPDLAPGLVLEMPAGGGTAVLVFDEGSHEWQCPALARSGACLVDLGAWRWGVSDAKAAHRIARLCGLRRPVP